MFSFSVLIFVCFEIPFSTCDIFVNSQFSTRSHWVLKLQQRCLSGSDMIFFCCSFFLSLFLLTFLCLSPFLLFPHHCSSLTSTLCSSPLSPSFLWSGPVGPQRDSEHFQAAQTNQQQSAAVRPRHHQLPDIHLRWPGAGAQRPCQCATLRWHVSQLASQRLWHVRELDQYGSRTIKKATTIQISLHFWINMLYIIVGVVLAEAGVGRSVSCPWRSAYYLSAKDTWRRNTNVSADTFAKYLPTHRF